MGLTFGSLFAGIGGFDLGFERCGMQCKWQVEIDDYATKILEQHWPSVHRERDIKQCGRHNLQRVDIIAGGFPCQDISYAGKGAGLDGERSGLFFEAIRLVRELRPRAVVLENVAGLLTRGLDRVLGTLAEVGFDAEWHCIPAAAVGAPHIRDRVFVLAYASSKRQPAPSNNEIYFAKAKDKKADQFRSSGKVFSDTDSTQRQRGSVPGRVYKEHSNFGSACWWSTEPAMGGLVNGVSGGLVRFAGRVATGIPNRANKLRGLGNAVVPQVAEVVGRMVIDRLGGE